MQIRVLRTAKRALRVNHPYGAEQWTKPRREGLRILKHGECSVEAESVLGMQCLKAIHELAPEHFYENIDRRKNRCCESIQREWSAARPPAGTTQ
jgi:hypothetical protein